MKTCTKCGEAKVKSEFYRDSRAKDGLYSACRVCSRAAGRAWGAANKDKKATLKRAWDMAHPEKNAEYCRKRYAENREKYDVCNKKWADNNPRRTKEINRASLAKWRRDKPNEVNAHTAGRRARKLQATPAWADQRGIKLWYKGAVIMTQLMGKPYHVDHSVPLKSKLVCGLHVPANLQILPASENIAKSNRYWPDMPQRRA